ncbi:MAG: tetratricopeptide repeat protein [Hyphomicrobiaceae bacterium]
MTGNAVGTVGLQRPGEAGNPLPSLAVVPYETCGADRLIDDAFATCLTLQLTQSLQRVDGLRVAAPSSTVNLARMTPVAEIGRQLRVDYVLKGVVKRAGGSLFFEQTLFDGASGQLLVTTEAECGLGDLHGFERDILARLASDVRLPLLEAEIERVCGPRPRNKTAYELALRAQVMLLRLDRRSVEAARRLLNRALDLDPDYATAYAWLARIHSLRIGQGWARDRKGEADEALRLAEIAIAREPRNVVALATTGHVHSYLRRSYVAGEHLLRRAIHACPNEPLGWLLLGATLAYTGRPQQGRELVEYALTLSPLDSSLHIFLNFAAMCCYAAGDYEDAVAFAHKAESENPSYSATYKVLACALVGLGRVAEARAVAARLRAIEPHYTFEAAARALPFDDPLLRELALRQLRTAGVFDRTDAARKAVR